MIETLIFIAIVFYIFYGFVKSSGEKRIKNQKKEDKEELIQYMLDDYR
jgi:Na+-translocating ferredoxin:NAD+ oxidoreductase RnfG subunit